FFFSSRRRHTRSKRDWSSDVCSSDLTLSRNYCVICLSSTTVNAGLQLKTSTLLARLSALARALLSTKLRPTGILMFLNNRTRWRSEERRVGNEDKEQIGVK